MQNHLQKFVNILLQSVWKGEMEIAFSSDSYLTYGKDNKRGICEMCRSFFTSVCNWQDSIKRACNPFTEEISPSTLSE